MPLVERTGPRLQRCILWLAVAASLFAGAVLTDIAVRSEPGANERSALAAMKDAYRRPTTLPETAANPITPEKIALGERLFSEKRLSLDGSKSCASCHDPSLAFTDGAPLGRGVPGTLLDRHTPMIWNLAWSRSFFWDGRADTLEQQARGPIESPKEMALPLAEGVKRLAADPDYQALFRQTFPKDPAISETNLLEALAAFERTLVSPATRFDAWIEGSDAALSAEEVAGFVLFNGKAGCNSCHSGWSFTDHSFHDIGLAGDDLGRGKVLELAALDRAFKTPSLRELVWTAPYMHDGSMATLDDVLRHYESGGIARPTRSKEMPAVYALTAQERNALLAFLESLSSERPPKPQQLMARAREETAAALVATSTVYQRSKMFSPAAISIGRGETLTVVNDDVRPHNFRIHTSALKLDTGVQQPGERTVFPMMATGTFEAFCGIHPSMRLVISVK